DGLLLRALVEDLQALLLHLPPVVRPRVRNPKLARAERVPKVCLRRPDQPDVLLLRLEQVLRLLELRVRLVPRILEAEVEAGDGEHVEVVEPRDLALVSVVEDEAPRLRLRLDLVAAVKDRVEAPVVR